MMMKRNIFILILLTCATALFAQKDGFSVHGGGIFPVGKWADAGVSAGFDVGVKYQYNLPVHGLGVIGTFDLMFNGLTKDGKAVYNNINNTGKYDSYKRTTPKTLNFPIMAGVNYYYDFGNISVWGETALGLNICKETNYKFEGTYDWEAVTNKYYYTYRTVTRSTIIKSKAYANCAFQFGLGAMFGQRMSVGVHFYVFGGASETTIEKYDVTNTHARSRNGKKDTEHTRSWSDKDDSEFSSSGLIPTPFFSIRLGYHF